MHEELFEKIKNEPLEKLRATRNTLDQLIRRQGATRENIDLLTNDIRSIEQEIHALQNISMNLRPLVIDANTINQSNPTKR
jgi:arsenate reductase-like glutaredoxin family protein